MVKAAKAGKPVMGIICVYRGSDDIYDIPDGVAEVLMQSLGMEYTQAKNCEGMILRAGKYNVHHTYDFERAGLILDSLKSEGLTCKLLYKLD